MKKVSPAMLFLCLMVLCCLSAPSFAIMKGLSTEELTKDSDIVILGEVENIEAQWSKDEKTIFTRADILINTINKGARRGHYEKRS